MNQGTSCIGCGTPLQTEHQDRAGYVPAHVKARSGDVRCRRCYRLEHYGTQQATEPMQQSVEHVAADAASTVHDTIASADAILMIVDVWDFEGSFLPDILKGIKAPVFFGVNKVDLLPARTPTQEVLEWVRQRLTDADIAVQGIRLISAEKGTGMRALRRELEQQLPPKTQLAVVGVTNVGKSSLLRRWLPKGVRGPTTSDLPGTTQHIMQHRLGREGPIVLDTPGLIPGHRISDRLCPQCAATLVPRRRLRSKLVQLHRKNAIVLGGLAAIQVRHIDKTINVTLAFTSERVPIHVTRADRAVSLLREAKKAWLHTYCGACQQRIEQGGWEDVQVTVDEGKDLVIPGLGWISPRKASLPVTVTVPAGTQVIMRPRLVGTKRQRIQ